jgi:tetratricopeptide (TPR) repeat protein
MESVVAANPGVIPMRLALARRYLEAGDFDKALDHYFVILEVEQNPEALANIGWMTHLSGRPDIAVGYVEAALERDPTSLTAHWYVGNIYVTLDRGEEAIVHLTILASNPDLPDEVRDAAVELIRGIEESRG